MANTIVFYDTEFTSWEGAMANNWAEDWQYKELVQIGAIRFDIKEMVQIEKFDVFIRPKENPVLSDYFINLTGITNEQIIEKGIDFEDAFKQFIAFAKDDTCYSYGGDDSVISENCDLYDCSPSLISELSAGDIAPWFSEQGIDTKTVNSGALAKTLGVELDIFEHNALDDVRSICAAFKYLVHKGASNPFLK